MTIIKQSKVGERWRTNQGCWIEIVEALSNGNCLIKFLEYDVDNHTVKYSNIKSGSVKNPFCPSLCNTGYTGSFYNTVPKKVRKLWEAIIGRCYNINKDDYIFYGAKGVIVHESWHNLQIFATWYYKNHEDGWDLDKDILQKGNKIYSPETCCFVPQEINKLFVKNNKIRGKYPIGIRKHKNGKYEARLSKSGKSYYLGLFYTPEEAFQAYKTEKEEYIKEMADEWRGQITEPCYEAMYVYQVEITD